MNNPFEMRFLPKISSPGYAEIHDGSTDLLYGFRRYKDGKCFAFLACEIFEIATYLNLYVKGCDVRLSSSAVNIIEQLDLCWNNWTLLFRGTLWPGDDGAQLTTMDLASRYQGDLTQEGIGLMGDVRQEARGSE